MAHRRHRAHDPSLGKDQLIIDEVWAPGGPSEYPRTVRRAVTVSSDGIQETCSTENDR